MELFTNKVNNILDKMAPVKTFQTSSKYCPWLSEETKKLIKERNRSQELLSESKTDENFKNYKNYRNKVTSSLKKDKHNGRKLNWKAAIMILENSGKCSGLAELVFFWFSFKVISCWPDCNISSKTGRDYEQLLCE